MLQDLSELEDYAIHATDGSIGHVKDFYFDDEAWVIRYLIVDTHTWLPSHKVLISPISIGHANWMERVLSVSITRDQVKNSPDIDTEQPVSRQHEMRFLRYYGYPYYWGGASLWGGGLYPNMMLPGYPGLMPETTARPGDEESYAQAEAARHQDADPHLRSSKAVMALHIHATDGDIGHVHGLLADEETWAIRYIIINTSNWWLGHQVLVAPQWISNMSWSDATVSVNLTRKAVKDAPPYESAAQLDRKQERSIYEHYRRPGYWANE